MLTEIGSEYVGVGDLNAHMTESVTSGNAHMHTPFFKKLLHFHSHFKRIFGHQYWLCRNVISTIGKKTGC